MGGDFRIATYHGFELLRCCVRIKHGCKNMKTYFTAIELPIGWVLLVGQDGVLTQLELAKSTREAALTSVPEGAVESPDAFGDLPERLRLYMDGGEVDFSDVAVDFGGLGPFSERVLRETMKVPFGKLISYRDLAAIAGSPGAARAVGNAMSRNPVPIVVPCHRVVHSDGTLGGYTGGLDVKIRLLTLEGVAP